MLAKRMKKDEEFRNLRKHVFKLCWREGLTDKNGEISFHDLPVVKCYVLTVKDEQDVKYQIKAKLPVAAKEYHIEFWTEENVIKCYKLLQKQEKGKVVGLACQLEATLPMNQERYFMVVLDIKNPLPKVVIKGKTVDKSGVPLRGVTVYAHWDKDLNKCNLREYILKSPYRKLFMRINKQQDGKESKPQPRLVYYDRTGIKAISSKGGKYTIIKRLLPGIYAGSSYSKTHTSRTYIGDTLATFTFEVIPDKMCQYVNLTHILEKRKFAKICGKIADEAGNPVSGAMVFIDYGTSFGTKVSDKNGCFTSKSTFDIEAAVITIMHPKYKTKQIPVGYVKWGSKKHLDNIVLYVKDAKVDVIAKYEDGSPAKDLGLEIVEDIKNDLKKTIIERYFVVKTDSDGMCHFYVDLDTTYSITPVNPSKYHIIKIECTTMIKHKQKLEPYQFTATYNLLQIWVKKF
jgi:hypothetical protein